MCKMVAWFPRGDYRPDQRALSVRTTADAMLVAVDASEQTVWRYNADHVRRWVAEHGKLIQRLAEDQKAEQRPVPSFSDLRTAAARKFRDRMDSACHEISRSLVNYAVRRKISVIHYDDSERGYCPDFQWFNLKHKIEVKCRAAGITFEDASAKVEDESPEALAAEETQ